MNHEYPSIEQVLTSASPERCAELIKSLGIDIQNTLKPNALQIKLGALSREMDEDDYRNLRLAELLKTLDLVVARFRELTHIHA